MYLGAMNLLRCVLRYKLDVPIDRHSGANVFRGVVVSVNSRRDLRGSLDACSSRLLGVGGVVGTTGNGAVVLVSRFNANARPNVNNTVTRTILSGFYGRRTCNIVAARCRGLGRFTSDRRKIMGNTVLCSHRRVGTLFRLTVNHPNSSFTVRVTEGVKLPRRIVGRTSSVMNSRCVRDSGCLRSVIHSGQC